MVQFRDPRQGGMPMQGGPGGMPQPGGTQIGGGPPPPRPGPGQLGAGGGQQQQPPQMPFMPGGNARMMGGGGGSGGGNRGELQSTLDHYQRQLMMAQINGAPPQIIAALQMQLQQAQRAYQEAGIQAMYGHQMNRPQPGLPGPSSGGGGGAQSPYYGQQMQDWGTTMQMLSQLWGLGGGGRGPVGG